MTLKRPITFETTFSSYSADRLVGEGGAGRVYEARDESGAGFAIKLLDSNKATTEKRKRFKNELLFSARNKHPNIITVVDHGIFSDGKRKAPFYVMPYMTGSLRTLLAKGLVPEQVLTYFGQMLDGVEAAHLQKVVHRDLKPENVLYDKSRDMLLIADFGVARFEEEELYTLVETSPATRLANFQYAAPEQRARGQAVDQLADLYALGLMLNEMFTGHVPSGTDYKTIGSVAPAFAYLDDLVALMLRQNPSDRPGSIEAVKQQLIAQRNEFITRQKLSELAQTVVPITDLDDPLVSDPPRLIGFDWDRNMLTLELNQPVNERWIWALQNMGNHTSMMGKEPGRFQFKGKQALIAAEERQVQALIDYFKSWLPAANQKYEQSVRTEKLNAENKQRARLRSELEEQDRRQRILKNTKL